MGAAVRDTHAKYPKKQMTAAACDAFADALGIRTLQDLEAIAVGIAKPPVVPEDIGDIGY